MRAVDDHLDQEMILKHNSGKDEVPKKLSKNRHSSVFTSTSQSQSGPALMQDGLHQEQTIFTALQLAERQDSEDATADQAKVRPYGVF